jgi:hypothetical protein
MGIRGKQRRGNGNTGGTGKRECEYEGNREGGIGIQGNREEGMGIKGEQKGRECADRCTMYEGMGIQGKQRGRECQYRESIEEGM